MTEGSERVKIALEKPLDPDLAAEIEKQAAYVSPRIKNVRAYGTTIEWEGDDEKMERFVRAMTAKHRAVPKKTIATRPFGTLHDGVHDELVRRGWVIDLGRGQLGLAGPALALARLVDADCARMGHRFGAIERAFPSLIPASVLSRCGYFGSFPQSLSFVAHLGEDFDRLEAFRTANSGSDLVIPDRGDLVFEACLAPAVCYHAYQSLEGTRLPEDGIVIGCAGRCYRYESSNLTGLERLWDFSMREIVFLGALEQVLQRRNDAMNDAMAQLERFGLGGSIVGASDPFFPTTSATKRFWQASTASIQKAGRTLFDPSSASFSTSSDLSALSRTRQIGSMTMPTLASERVAPSNWCFTKKLASHFLPSDFKTPSSCANATRRSPPPRSSGGVQAS